MLTTSKKTRREPLRVQFLVTSLPVGGAEVLLLNLIDKLNRNHIEAEVICLKEPGELGEKIASLVPLHSNLLSSKWDLRVLTRLIKLFRERRTDAVVTIGAGDKMFWGRLAGKLAGVPVIASALHSTGWPDGVGKLNRALTTITDAFIAVAENHALHLIQHERFPRERVFLIPNGVDTDRFRPNHTCRAALREELGLAESTQLVGIVAALRDEKNHGQFVEAAREILRNYPRTHFVIVGDGPKRAEIEAQIRLLGIQSHFHLLGVRSDTEHILAALDVFCLTSRNEANPVSILEALACGIPVVSPDVGSIRETVIPRETGYLTKPLCPLATADGITQILIHPTRGNAMGLAGRQLVRGSWSLEAMVGGYTSLLQTLYNEKAPRLGLPLLETTYKASLAAESETREQVSTAPIIPALPTIETPFDPASI